MSKQDGILGGPAPYGYERDWTSMKIKKSEAKVVQLVFDMLANGYSKAAITRWLNLQRIPTPTGDGEWWPASVDRSVIQQKRKYKGGPIRRLGNGAKWPAILGVDLDAEPEPEPEPVEPPKPAKRRHVARKMRQLSKA